MSAAPSRLLLLCERGGFAPMQQAVSAAAAALAVGSRVDLVLFHSALARFLDGRLDDPEGLADPDALAEAIALGRVRPVSAMLEEAREAGLRLHACSASIALLGREAADLPDELDEVVGWPTIHRWSAAADRVLSF